jgi:microcystin degradation protein MlrC
MRKIAIAGFQHETNTFSPLDTGINNFHQGGVNANHILKGNEINQFQIQEMNNATSGFMRTIESLGYQSKPLIWMEAEPSSCIPLSTFELLLEMILDAITEILPVDGLFLDLHGAMVFGDHLDGETEILRQIRSQVGNIPIVAALDLHGNITKESFQLASMLIGYRTYPHVDIYETGMRCAYMMDCMLNGCQFSKSFMQLPFLIPTSRQNTFMNPLQSIFSNLDLLEKQEKILSASIMLGFPPADINHCGPTIITYAKQQNQADQAAQLLYDSLLDCEDDFTPALTPIHKAIDETLSFISSKEGKPLILADVQDNPGGGSGSDSIWLLEAFLNAGIKNAAFALFYDPQAATVAHKAGEGSEITIGLGGKMLPGHTPLTGTFTVIKLLEGEVVGTGPMSKGMVIDLGKMALLEISGIYISVGSARIQAADQAVFTAFGLDPMSMDVIVLKSFIHFRAAFEEIAGKIIEVEAPGAEFDDPSKVTYHYLREGVRLFGNGPVHRVV